MAGIFDILPGYLKMPTPADTDFETYLEAHHARARRSRREWDSFNYWSNTPKFAVSFLKAMYGDAATKENDWAFHYLPKIDRNYSWVEIWDDMYEGKVKGLLDLRHERRRDRPELAEEHRRAEEGRLAGGLRDLSRRDQRVLECAGHHARRDEDRSRRRSTACPARASPRRTARSSTRRAGCSGRTPRCRRPASASSTRRSWRSIFLKVRELYQKEGGKFPDPILNSALDLHATRTTRRSPRSRGRSTARRSPTSPIAKRIRPIKAGQQLPGFGWLERRRHDAVAATGCTAARGPRRARRCSARGTDDPSGLGIYPNWAWSWPANRRVLYNRASCDLDGQALGPGRAGRSGGTKRSRGGSATTCPTSRPTRRPRITWARSS